MRRLACVAVLCCTAFATSSVPATADPDPLSVFSKMIMKKVKQKRVIVLSAGSRLVLLACEPYDASTHPTPQKACAELAAVGGDPAELEPDPGVRCTMEYDPVQATATGTWEGREIRYRHTFSNPCVMRSETGSVFAFSTSSRRSPLDGDLSAAAWRAQDRDHSASASRRRAQDRDHSAADSRRRVPDRDLSAAASRRRVPEGDRLAAAARRRSPDRDPWTANHRRRPFDRGF
ncbi:SSI family serine proteinase inhibitor [Nonomuraea sp. NPDC049152]|uniref:SSI family serine proteinase inhibitor n=1 Tax=Nonomuraea sp. NPDC049152 TaxID=3154350 RepID=UPI0034039436